MDKVLAEGYFNYFLPLSKVKKLDKWLVDTYSIDCFIDFEDLYSYRGIGASKQELLKVDRLIKQYINHFDSENVDRKFKVGLELTNIYSTDSWRSWWHSTRRAWLIDSLSFCSSIISSISKSKNDFKVIDVGCNVGIFSNYLSENYSINVTGIDVSRVAISAANQFKKSVNVTFLESSLEECNSGNEWDLVIAVDFVQPNEHNFVSLMEKIGSLVKSNGHLIVVGNFIDVENIDEFFRSIGFSCLGAQLTGGYQQGHSDGFAVDWSTKAALHFKKNIKLKSVNLPISGRMNDFATYANSGEFLPRELNRSYFLPRISKNLIK